MKRDGFLDSGVWTRRYVAKKFPTLLRVDGTIDESKIPSLDEESQRQLGKVVFMYHCASCHSIQGHMGMKEFLVGWKPNMLDSLIQNLSSYSVFMPPWSGTEEEALALRKYLETLASKNPIEPAASIEGGSK
jgi:mono/diheme cytochrome c family protein